MISCPSVRKDAIRDHYDLAAAFYRLLWGPHIHHGLWNDGESPRQAQRQLIETLAWEAGVREGDSVLDIGCGTGGTSVHLARLHGCAVTGITLSPRQRRWAARSAWWHGVKRRTQFRCGDVEQAEFPPAAFDVVWSVECTEHLFDKAAFFRRAAGWLKPGGRMAICAWLAGDRLETDAQRQRVYDVCEGFLCPSLGTSVDYRGWMEAAGLKVQRVHDWTARVIRTWEICQRRVDRWGVRHLARLVSREMSLFLDRFETILEAYRTGAMQYGCFVATREG